MLSVPPPTRVALGTIEISGKKFELYVSPEWARYFQSLNGQVLAGGVALAGSAPHSALLAENGEAPDWFPSPPGPPGPPGQTGPALFLLQDDARDEAPLLPPAPSAPVGPVPGSFTTLTASAGFGCNGKAAQGAAASGGTLAGVIAALVANGILSS
jgi:hypothetical protein